jgi:hypothetical protein
VLHTGRHYRPDCTEPIRDRAPQVPVLRLDILGAPPTTGRHDFKSSATLARMIDAELLLRSVVGEQLSTVRGHPNTVLRLIDGEARVATSRSPQGQPVPIAWLQSVLDRLGAGETVAIEPAAVGYRSAFLGAVLRAVPQLELLDETPPRVRVDPAADVSPVVLAELERRLGMWADLRDAGGPTRVAPGVLRSLGIYGGASGIWTDSPDARHRLPGGSKPGAAPASIPCFGASARRRRSVRG